MSDRLNRQMPIPPEIHRPVIPAQVSPGLFLGWGPKF